MTLRAITDAAAATFDIPGMQVAARFAPVDPTGKTGGDFYDVFRLHANAWALAIGDVCGNGAAASSLAAIARHAVRTAAGTRTLPSGVLADLNRVLLAEPECDERFLSAVFARVELDMCGAWVTLACAGHPRPMLVRAAGWIDVRGQPGSLLGLFDDPEVEDDRVGLGPGDSLVICTDGITEARDPAGEQFGDDRLPEVLLAATAFDADHLADHLLGEVLRWSHGRVDDDAAVLVLRVAEDARRDPVGRVRDATGADADALPLPGYEIGDERRDLPASRPSPPREARLLLPEAADAPARGASFVRSILRTWRVDEVDGDEAERLTTATIAATPRPVTVIVRYDGATARVEVGGHPGTPTSFALPRA